MWTFWGQSNTTEEPDPGRVVASPKDTLFDDGRADDGFSDPCLALEEQVVHFQKFSGDSKRCQAVLKSLRQEDESILGQAFHDLMVFRTRISGLGSSAYRRMVFSRWKSFLEESRLRKLRSDAGLMHLCDFLSNLSDGEREMVIPLLCQARTQIEEHADNNLEPDNHIFI